MPVALPFIGAAIGAAADVAIVGAEAVTFAGVLSAASLGFSAATVIGNVLFPTHTSTTSEGPRLGDLSIQTSTYGAAIPITFGTDRLSGNIIWSLPIKEVANTTSTGGGGGKKGGKGGGSSSTNTTYSYFGTFAVGLCEGVKGSAIRIWADNNLIYDARTGKDVVQKAGVNFGFYGGSETQIPDAHIEADKGVGNVPAFRGLCYVVFVDLPLQDFGNRIPSLSFEVADQIDYVTTILPLTPMPDSILTSTNPSGFWTNLTVNPIRTIGYVDWGFGDHLVPTGIARFSLETMVVDKEILWTDIITSTLFNVDTGAFTYSFIVGTDEFLYVMAGGGTTPIFTDQYVVKIDPVTLLSVTYGFIGTTVSGVGAVLLTIRVYGTDGTQHDFVISIVSSGVVLTPTFQIATVDCATMASSGYSTYPGILPIGVVGALSPGYSDLWVVDQAYFPTILPVLARVRIYPDGSSDHTVIRTYDGTEFDPTSIGVENLTLNGYDLVAHVIIMTIFIATPTSGRSFLFGSSVDGTILWSNDTSAGPGGADTRPFYQNVSGTILTSTPVGTASITNTSDGSFYEVGSTLLQGSTRIWDSNTFSYLAFEIHTIERVFIGRKTGLTTTLGAICENVSARVGNSAVDTSEIDEVVVAGYTLSRTDTAANDLNTLLAAFQVDVVETDFLIVFKARGSAPLVTLTEDLLVRDTSSEAPEPYKEGWQQALELPSYLSITYEDQAIDYQPNTQHDQRVTSGTVPPVLTGQAATLQVPVAMSAESALRMAQTLLYTTWLNRHTFKLKLSPRHLWLDAADVIQLTLNNGYTLRTRLGKTDFGSDFSLDTLLISETDGQYTSTLTIDTVNNAPLELASTGPSLLILLDVPLLRDGDEVISTSSRGYWGASTFSSATYHGATLFESPDAVNWTQLSAVSHATPFGHVETPPPDPTLMWTVETGTSLVVAMANGESHLVSVSDLDLCNGFNAAALIKTDGEVEILQYRDVASLGGGRFTLSNLLRGRRGTDTMAFNHVAGETLVLLGTGSLSEISGAIADRDVSLWFGAVTSGASPNPNLREAFTFHARDKFPYAPVNVTATLVGSDVELGWIRRTRIGGALRDSGDVPLSETTESYQIDVLVEPGGAVVRTLTSVTTSVLYLEAQILADFGVRPASLTVRVYQMSAAVGRGFSREDTLTIT